MSDEFTNHEDLKIEISHVVQHKDKPQLKSHILS